MDRAVLHLPQSVASALYPLGGGPGSTLVLGAATAVRGPAAPDGSVPLTLSGTDVLDAVRSVVTGARTRDDAGWTYRDAAGATRGPFPFARVEAWARAGFWADGFLLTDAASGVAVPSRVAVAAFGTAPPPAPTPAAADDSDADMEDVAAALASARGGGGGGGMDVDAEADGAAANSGSGVAAAAAAAAALLVCDTSAVLTRFSLVDRVLQSAAPALAAVVPGVVACELDALKARGGDLAPSARAALAAIAAPRVCRIALETPADVAACPPVTVPGASTPPTADDRVLATALRWAAAGRARARPLAVVLVTMDRGLAARARAVGVTALPPRDLPRGQDAVAALAAGMAGAAGPPLAAAPSIAPPPPPLAPAPSWQALTEALDDAVADGLVPALTAALAAQFGAAWPELTPDPPPFSPDAALAAIKAMFASTLEDHYANRPRARAARRAAEAALRAARRARGGAPDAVAARAAALADLMSDFPLVTGPASPEAAALAAARCTVAAVARAVDERMGAR